MYWRWRCLLALFAEKSYSLHQGYDIFLASKDRNMSHPVPKPKSAKTTGIKMYVDVEGVASIVVENSHSKLQIDGDVFTPLMNM